MEEHCNLCEDASVLFPSPGGFQLPSWDLEGKLSKSEINGFFSNGLGN